MRRVDELLRLVAIEPGQVDEQIGGNAEATFRTRADPDRRGHLGLIRDLHLELLAGNLQRADEARGIARREQLLGVGPVAAGAAELLRGRQLGLEPTVLAAGLTLAAADCRCGRGVFYVDSHDGLLIRLIIAR